MLLAIITGQQKRVKLKLEGRKKCERNINSPKLLVLGHNL